MAPEYRQDKHIKNLLTLSNICDSARYMCVIALFSMLAILYNAVIHRINVFAIFVH